MNIRTSTVLLALVACPSMGAAQSESPEPSVCIAMPKMQVLDGNSAEAAGSLRDMFASYLTGPTLKSVPLEARLVSQAMEEARQKGCTRVLVTSVTQKRGGGGSRLGRVVGDAAGTAIWHLPVGSAAGAAARSAAAAGAQAVSSVSATTRAKDELTLEYRVDLVSGGSFLRARTEKAKAQADGQDLLTPLVEKASEAVAASLAGKP